MVLVSFSSDFVCFSDENEIGYEDKAFLYYSQLVRYLDSGCQKSANTDLQHWYQGQRITIISLHNLDSLISGKRRSIPSSVGHLVPAVIHRLFRSPQVAAVEIPWMSSNTLSARGRPPFLTILDYQFWPISSRTFLSLCRTVLRFFHGCHVDQPKLLNLTDKFFIV